MWLIDGYGEDVENAMEGGTRIIFLDVVPIWPT